MKDNAFGWDRRFFVVGGAAVAAVLSFYMAAVGRGALKKCNHEDVEAGLPSDLQSLIRIGNSYLNEHAKNGELDSLNETLLDETATISGNIVHAVQRRLLAIDRQVRDEFARCETVICDGWVLANSEARLCAMVAARARRL
jgi:hypothetical protein